MALKKMAYPLKGGLDEKPPGLSPLPAFENRSPNPFDDGFESNDGILSIGFAVAVGIRSIGFIVAVGIRSIGRSAGLLLESFLEPNILDRTRFCSDYLFRSNTENQIFDFNRSDTDLVASSN